jgi:RES domain-containing protein
MSEHSEFKDYNSYYIFARTVQCRWRYMLDPEKKAFLEAVRVTVEKRATVLRAGERLWRAQHGCDSEDQRVSGLSVEQPCPYRPERMKPHADRASEGRANPKGIAHLYLATDRYTALVEVRPWKGSYVSVGEFRTLQDLRVVNCATEEQGLRIHVDKPSEEWDKAVWRDIDRAFAEPVSRVDDVADYAPTQALVEFFKLHGLDGVLYRSHLSKSGHNVVLHYSSVDG